MVGLVGTEHMYQVPFLSYLVSNLGLLWVLLMLMEMMILLHRNFQVAEGFLLVAEVLFREL